MATQTKVPLSQIMKIALRMLQEKPMGPEDIQACLDVKLSIEEVEEAIQALVDAGKVRDDKSGMYFLTNG